MDVLLALSVGCCEKVHVRETSSVSVSVWVAESSLVADLDNVCVSEGVGSSVNVREASDDCVPVEVIDCVRDSASVSDADAVLLGMSEIDVLQDNESETVVVCVRDNDRVKDPEDVRVRL